MKILYFSAKWCGPCQRMKVIIDKFMKAHPNVIEKIDVDENEQKKLEHNIMSVPTFIIQKDNKETRITGAITMEKLESYVKTGR